MSDARLHKAHPEIVKRLKRANGHLGSVISMTEVGRPCLELAQQLHAVEKAIMEAKKALIRDHLDHCLEATIGPLSDEQRHAMDEMKEIARYL
jgi:uncharacterized protein